MMNTTFARTLAVALGCVALTSCATLSPQLETSMSNKDKSVALLNSIETGDKAAVAYINAEQYTQHNQALGDGLVGFGAALQALPTDSAKVDVKRVYQDGDYVFTHTDYNFFGPKVGFDVFRFEDGLIVEHWDNLDAKADVPNPSGRTQFDGPTAVEDLDKTEANKALVSGFITEVLMGGQYDKLTSYISETQYDQHNTQVADGLDGLGQAIAAMAEQGIHMVYTANHKVLGEGSFVLAISEGTFGGKPVSYYDLFRVHDDKIVEHWDVIEPLLPEAEWKNSNGKFGGL